MIPTRERLPQLGDVYIANSSVGFDFTIIRIEHDHYAVISSSKRTHRPTRNYVNSLVYREDILLLASFDT